jgi:colanic acid/amylovoran biosynthesis glycosyltransferase
MSAPRIGYLIGQFPAINHYYLLLEIGNLRAMGIDIRIASIDPPDRTPEELKADERALLPEIYLVKREPEAKALGALLGRFFGGPISFLSALGQAYSFTRTQRRPRIYALYYIAEAVLIARWMKRFEIGHLYASFTSNIAVLVRMLYGFPVSFGVYGYGELYDPIGTQLARKIDQSVFVRSVSKHGVGQMMLASPAEQWPKLRYIALGIAPEAFPPRALRSEQPFDIVCVGRLSPEKGHRLVLAALESLISQNVIVTIRFIGDGPDRAFLEADAARRGISSHVVFEGRVSQQRLDQVYGSASASVLASLYEGIPIVLMEAMSREIPCIAPAINGIPELIIHGESGMLFNPGDVEELAAQIIKLVQDSELAHRLGKAGRERILRYYDIAPNTAILADVFREFYDGRN